MNPLRLSALLASLTIATLAIAADADSNWKDKCMSCHGADGLGDTKMGKKLKIRSMADADFQASFTDADAIKAVKEGIKDPASGKVRMKPIEGFTDDEITALVAHVRSLKK
ncbi:MAG: cytochrome c [Opitutaceae bacterium]